MKRFLLPAIQVLVTLGLLWWIFRDPEKNRLMWDALQNANALWLVPGLAAVGIAMLLQTQRWVMLMAVQDIRMGWWRAWRLVMVGAFFNMFLLGSTGGDVVKIFYAMRETATKKSAAFLSVLVDRIIGLVALIAVAAVICALNFAALMGHPVTAALMGSLFVILGGSLGLIVAGFIVDRLQLAHRLPTWIPLHAKIVELASAFSIYARDGRTLVATFAISLPAHLLIFSAFYFAARAFTDTLTLMNVYCVMPVINTITALPISLSGVGVREGLFQKMFATLFNTPENIAVLVSLTGFFMTMVWGLAGGLVYLLYRPTGVQLSDIENQVEAAEKEIEQSA